MTLYDISQTVSPRTAPWPGDTPYSVVRQLKRSEGAAANLTAITLSPHAGSHADAYFHYEDEAIYPADMPLDAYLGPARLVTVTKRDGALFPADFAGVNLEGAERLLIHSHVSDLPDDQWAQEFPYLSPELVEWLAGLGIRLVGLDSPSVDALDSKELASHHALRRHGMVNLELLRFSGVPDGDYELIALPLKLDEACASPVRAVLRPVYG